MKNKNYLKVVSIFWILAISVVSIEATCNEVKMGFGKLENNSVKLTYQLPAQRALIPHSLKERIRTTSQEINSNLPCNTTTSMCGSFEGNRTLKNVSSWMGFEFKHPTGKYFIATYGQKAKSLGNGIYSTKKWDKKHFWINIGKKSVPLPIQPRFVGIDDESGYEWYTVDYVGYRIADAGIDYSNYPNNISSSALVLLINPKTKKVEEYHLEYYDENSEYVGDYSIKVGDEIESYFLGFKQGDDNINYLFSIENITTVTDSITFSDKEQYPGRDYNCSSCKDLDLSQVEFKYIFEAYGEARSNFTEPKPIMAKLTSATNSSADSSTSSEKSVPLSGLWMLFFFITAVAILHFKRNKNFN